MLEAHGYKDAYVETGKGPMATYRWRDVRYDYLLASSDFPHQMRHSRRVDSDTSDHYAIYVDIQLLTEDNEDYEHGMSEGDDRLALSADMDNSAGGIGMSRGGTGAW